MSSTAVARSASERRAEEPSLSMVVIEVLRGGRAWARDWGSWIDPQMAQMWHRWRRGPEQKLESLGVSCGKHRGRRGGCGMRVTSCGFGVIDVPRRDLCGTGGTVCAGLGGAGEGLVEVGDDVEGVFEADGDADEGVGDAEGAAGLGWHGGVGHGGGVGGEGVGGAEA